MHDAGHEESFSGRYLSDQRDGEHISDIPQGVHNHPSGDPSPSAEDIQVTRRIARAGALLGITLLDHIVIGGQNYVSLFEAGIFNER